MVNNFMEAAFPWVCMGLCTALICSVYGIKRKVSHRQKRWVANQWKHTMKKEDDIDGAFPKAENTTDEAQ